MPKQRSEYKEAKFDSNMKYIKESDWRSVPGEFYIWVFIHSDKAMVKKESDAKKVIPPHRLRPIKASRPVDPLHQDGNQ